MTKQREAMWQEMADLTRVKCQATCHSMGQCCEPVYCHMAAEIMQKAGQEFPSIPLDKTFIVDGKCVIPPHFRPLCTLHQCKIAGLGFDPNDKKWTERYFELRKKLSELYDEAVGY